MTGDMTFVANHVFRSANGLVRKNNEDAVLCAECLGLYAVADGMGGGAEGERASRMVCEALEKVADESSFARRCGDVGQALLEANTRIFGYAREKGLRQMGSTVALVAFDADLPRAAVCHVGDSRVYRIRAGAIEVLTRDHSIGAELETRVGGAFASRSNPLAHVLTRALGTDKDVKPEWRNVDVCAGDRFVVCSDGVHDVMADDALLDAVVAGTLDAAADRLEREVLAKGAPDNYSFVLVEIGGADGGV